MNSGFFILEKKLNRRFGIIFVRSSRSATDLIPIPGDFQPMTKVFLCERAHVSINYIGAGSLLDTESNVRLSRPDRQPGHMPRGRN